MAVLAREDWTGADGDPWSSQWVWGGGYDFQAEPPEPTIVGNAGRLWSGTGNSQGWGYSINQIDLPGTFGDFDARFAVTPQLTELPEQYFDLCWGVQGLGTRGFESVISFELSRYGGTWQARIWNSVTGNLVGTYYNFEDGDNLGGQKIRMRVKRTGGLIQAKAWKDGSAEPDWNCVYDGSDDLALYGKTGAFSFVTTAGPEDTSQYADVDELLITDGKPLGYLGGQPINEAYYGTQPISTLALG